MCARARAREMVREDEAPIPNNSVVAGTKWLDTSSDSRAAAGTDNSSAVLLLPSCAGARAGTPGRDRAQDEGHPHQGNAQQDRATAA